MMKSIRIVLTLGLIFCFSSINVAQQMYQIKKKSPKSDSIKTTVSKKDSVTMSDSLKQEIELHRGLLLRDTSSTK